MIPILLDEAASKAVHGYWRTELDNKKELKRVFVAGHLNYRLGFHHIFSTINYLRMGLASYWNASDENKQQLIKSNWNLKPPVAFLAITPIQGLGNLTAIVSKGIVDGTNLAVIESVRISLPDFFGINFPNLRQLYAGESNECLSMLEGKENDWPVSLFSKRGILSKEQAELFMASMPGGSDAHAFISALTAFFYAGERVGKALELLSIDVQGNLDVKIGEVLQPVYVDSNGSVAFTGAHPSLNLFEEEWKQLLYCVSPARFESSSDSGGG